MSVISRFRWRISIATAFTLLALVLSLVFALSSQALTFAAGLQLLQLSSDPFTNSTSQHRTEVEPDTFAFGSTIPVASCLAPPPSQHRRESGRVPVTHQLPLTPGMGSG